jgi:two-component system, LuxR family, response regulator FixJ
MAEPGGRCVYVIDDDKGVLDSTAFLLSALGYDCVSFAEARAFLDAAEALAPGCIVTDLRMPRMDGFELASALQDRGVRWPIVMITSETGNQVAQRAGKLGFAALLHKPINADLLADSLTEAFAAFDR